MTRSVPIGKLLVLTAALVAMGGSARTASAQDQQATVSVSAPSRAEASADHVDVSIDVANVQDLAGFQFLLTVDGSLLQPVSAKQTTFLAQSGREIFCGDPTIEGAAVRYACVTLRLTPPGVDGGGTLATVTLKPLKSGTSSLELSRVQLVKPDGSVIPSTAVNGTLKLTGAGGTTWWPYAAGGGAIVVLALAVGFAMMRRRSTPVMAEPAQMPDEVP